MSHLPILPIVIPFAAAAVLLLAQGASATVKRAISIASVAAMAIAAALLVRGAVEGGITVYRLGDWPAPYGIVLVVDRLAALMVALTAALAIPVLQIAIAGADEKGRHFHALLQLQVAGLSGAFLTGDLFNLFVFFEVLLLASYALLVHGGGAERVRAGLGYVILNLTGSAVFLIALGLVYGLLGTLNMVDLGIVLQKVAPADQAMVRTALMLLVGVFLLKAALLPLGFWLPGVYTAASTPVSVLFVIMTKVGIYSILRVTTAALEGAAFSADLLQPWLAWLAIATIALGALGALAAKGLAVAAANVIVISSGTLLLGVAAGGAPAIAAMLTYLVHTTIASAALFVLVDVIASQRGELADRIEKGPRLPHILSLGLAYLAIAVAVSAMPPMFGFVAKMMVLQALYGAASWVGAWSALILSGFVIALVLSRAASAYFWEPGKSQDDAAGAPATPATLGARGALLMTVLAMLVLVPLAGPVTSFATAAAAQLKAREAYAAAVIGSPASVLRERKP